jgi:dienelactone hydrolase
MSAKCRRRRLNGGAALCSVIAVCLVACQAAAAEPTVRESGIVEPLATADEQRVPQRFRLPEKRFAWTATRMQTVTDTLEVWDVTFPSPVNTPVQVNNTVHAEYYRSRLPGRRPAVIVLHILGGDFPLSRLFSNTLAQHGVHALFVKMPYYGPRRDPASPRRMVSLNPHETVEGMTQAVLDIRRATAWLASRPEIDASRLGVFGISLGGITAALALEAEPRLTRGCLLLAGGGVASAGWDAAQARRVREQWLAQGHTKDEFVEILAAVDPVTYAASARGKRILMLNASDDEVIPRASTEALARALGDVEVRWLAGGHYSVIRHLPTALLTVGHFFATE